MPDTRQKIQNKIRLSGNIKPFFIKNNRSITSDIYITSNIFLLLKNLLNLFAGIPELSVRASCGYTAHYANSSSSSFISIPLISMVSVLFTRSRAVCALTSSADVLR